ncbi:MAG: MCE family protein [Candidatus Omnitrophota bacterium]|nr:MAG: MCE family protein [Candidatus Omnitrophota bacterium]
MAEAENKIFELKVGIFIAIGILIFFIIVFSIGDVYLVRKGYHINVIFNFASGITESAPVRLAGVNVGQIDKINIFFDEKEKKTKVKLLAWVNDEKIGIERDSVALINTLGLLGEKYLEIFPGTTRDDLLEDGDSIVGQDPIPTERLTEKLDQIADSTNVVMTRLKEGEGTVGKLLVEEKIYNDLEVLVEDVKKHPWKLLHKPRTPRRDK